MTWEEINKELFEEKTTKRFTWLKKDVYAPQVVITDSLTGKDLTPIDCYDLLNALYNENEQLKEENNALIKLINDLGNEEMDRQMEEILND